MSVSGVSENHEVLVWSTDAFVSPGLVSKCDLLSSSSGKAKVRGCC